MIEKEKKIPVPVIRWLTLAVMLVPAFWSVFQGSGVLYHADKAWANPRTEFFRRDALHFKEYKLPQDANLLTNGNLIPLFYDHPHLMDVLSYEGNPKKLTASELKGEFYLLLTDDMREVNDCADIQVGGKNLKVDHEYFVAICERVKKNAQLVEAYPRSGLIALHILAL